MVKKKLLFWIASERGFIGNVSQPQLAKSLLTSLANGICEELTKKPSGRTSFFLEKYCNYQPVFLMPAAVPFIVKSAPLNNSLLL